MEFLMQLLIIKVLHYILSLMSPTLPQIFSLLIIIFPTSLYYVEKTFKPSKDQFEIFVIYPKCCSLHTFRECVQTSITGRNLSKSCNHFAFRNHSMASHRKNCGHQLLKEVILKADKKFYPLKTYCTKM